MRRGNIDLIYSLANQFMTQLTDKIREGILGNVGTIMSGRLGVTDAELMEKAFSPVFNAEDLHKQGNYQAIATVMMHNLPSAPFTMALLPPMGRANPQLMEDMKVYVAEKYGRERAEVEQEIKDRWKTVKVEEKTDTGVVSDDGKREKTGGFWRNGRKRRTGAAIAKGMKRKNRKRRGR